MKTYNAILLAMLCAASLALSGCGAIGAAVGTAFMVLR